MKKGDKLKKVAAETMDKIRAIARHIRNVEDNCLILGEQLILRGEIELGHKLIANGYVHDVSKFFGIEFEYLSIGTSTEEGVKLKQKMAVYHHQRTNLHHPEAWPGGIKEMPDVYLAEFCCDVKSRSEEFGTNLREWIDNEATTRFKFTKEDVVYKDIMKYVNLLCQKPFEDLSK
jgi:hypothetical protein